MNTIRLALLLTLVPGLVCAQDAGDHLLFVRVSAGLTAQDLGDVNDAIRSGQNLYAREGVVPTAGRETFGTAFDFGGEIGAVLLPRLTISAGARYQKSSVDNSTTVIEDGGFGGADITDEIELSLFEIAGALEFWLPGESGFHLGIHAGWGRGNAKGTYRRDDHVDPAGDVLIETDADGSGLMTGFYLGSRPRKHLFTRLGYRFRDLGEFTPNQDGSTTGTSLPPRDEQGRPINFDFSGFYLAIGFEFSPGI